MDISVRTQNLFIFISLVKLIHSHRKYSRKNFFRWRFLKCIFGYIFLFHGDKGPAMCFFSPQKAGACENSRNPTYTAPAPFSPSLFDLSVILTLSLFLNLNEVQQILCCGTVTLLYCAGKK